MAQVTEPEAAGVLFLKSIHLISSVNQFYLQSGLPHGANTITKVPNITSRHNSILRKKRRREERPRALSEKLILIPRYLTLRNVCKDTVEKG